MSKSMKFTKGQQVAKVPNRLLGRHSYPQYGEVVSKVDAESVVVKFEDHGFGYPETEIVKIADLMPEDEVKATVDRLEREFEELSVRVKAKVQAAADLLHEASEIAEDHDECLSEMHEAIAPLLDEMDEMGWSTSSLSC
jgi:hypothetical protein